MSTDTKQPNYWKSLNELAQNEEYKKYVHREFPENATELKDGVSRRGFLKVMGASIALAGFAACRRPVQKILPYSKQPEDVEEGVPMHYATAMPFQGVLTGMLVETNEGRPTKAEGNSDHPSLHGNSSVFEQAAILSLYDPDRSRSVLKGGEKSSWSDFVAFASEHFSDTNQRIAFISEENSSPTFHDLKSDALDKFPNAEWVTYEPFDRNNVYQGTKLAFGETLRPLHHFDKSNLVVSIDDDFLNAASNPNYIQDAKQYSKAREVLDTSDEMSRLYMVENTLTITGTNADNRLRVKAAEIPLFLYALAAELSKEISGLNAFSGYSNKFSGHEWIGVLAEELIANQGESIITAGSQHGKQVHAAVAAINSALGNIDNTITYLDVPYIDDVDQHEKLREITNAMNSGEIDTAVIVGGNPAYNAPADLDFENALDQVETSIQLSEYQNETAALADWHVNQSHFLESWGDGFSYDGVRSVIQPMIKPLFGGKNELEFLNAVVTGTDKSAYKIVQAKWNEFYPANFRANWRKTLHNGFDSDGHFKRFSGNLVNNFATGISEALSNAGESSGMELVFRPDNGIHDGSFANNGWLQEMPNPVTKITWDNVALMSKATAEQLGVKNEDVISINTGDAEVEIAAWILPGHADDSITVTTGYGRENLGRVADGHGVNVNPLRTSDDMFVLSDVTVDTTGRTYEIATTQDHHSMEGRSIVRSGTIEQYREDPNFASFKGVYGHDVPGTKEAAEMGEEDPINLFDDQDYPEYEPQWGMTIDLNTCTGCSACVVACVAENNIPVIGKREVRRGREMHWIRTDRYFEGDVDEPDVVHQPVPCMQCELAPCEQVCPVAATTHSDDGMNQMTYNRCIGTRYCANNCPYKVRRFNFFNYAEEYLTDGKDPEVIQMAMNPEVTVRFRGVMEKCTYCVQRVNRAKINRKIETNGESIKPEDGAVETACQQACPANAIVFGDLTDENSRVSQLKRNERNYSLLEELNTRPRTTYLAGLKNPNPKLTPVSTHNNDHH